MKKVKFAFWIIILVLFGLLIWQNQPFFLNKDKTSLALNLYFTAGRTIPVFNLIIIVAFFCFGLLIAYTSSLLERFRAGKTIKALRANALSLQSTIDEMKNDIQALKSASAGRREPQPEEENKIEPPTEEAEPAPQG